MRTIKLKEEQLIDEGSFAAVYRISPRRVVKAFFYPEEDDVSRLADDEIKGSKKYKRALPVLAKVKVIFPNGTESIGLVKKYLPYEIYDERAMPSDSRCWDASPDNYRMDYDGTVWLIDTQTINCFNYSRTNDGYYRS